MSTLLLLIGLLPSLLCELPATPIELSKETTFITEPLAGDGLPNFALAIQELESKGVTPEENGAIPFWQAMGQCDMTDEEFKQLSLAIDLSQNNETKRLIPLGDKSTIQAVVDWLRDTGRSSDEEELQKLAKEHIAWVQSNPWTAKDVPPLAVWLAENEHALELLVEASEKPRFYSPYPNLLVDHTVPVWDMKLQHATEARKAARALMARAMYSVGQDDLDGAWKDCRACLYLGNQLTYSPCLLERLVGISLGMDGLRSVQVVMSQPDVSSILVLSIYADLTKLDRPINLSTTFDAVERLMAIDYALRTATGRLGGLPNEERGSLVGQIAETGVDLNLSLRWINQRYDRIVLESQIKDRKERDEQLGKFVNETNEESERMRSLALLGRRSQTFRSNALGQICFTYTYPDFIKACKNADQHEQYLMLTRIAAALAVYKTEHGHYPNKLAELSRFILPEVPKDLYTEEPLQYEKKENGFLLYSVFENKADDGASDLYGEIRNGEWQADEQEVDREKSDLVIRIPVLPQPKP